MFLSSCYLTSDLYWEKDTVKNEAPMEPAHRLGQEVFSLPWPMLTLGFGSPSRSGMTTLLSCRHPSSLCRNPELSSGFPHYLFSLLHQPGPEASIFYLLFLKLSSYKPLMTEPKKLKVSRETRSSFLAVNGIWLWSVRNWPAAYHCGSLRAEFWVSLGPNMVLAVGVPRFSHHHYSVNSSCWCYNWKLWVLLGRCLAPMEEVEGQR